MGGVALEHVALRIGWDADHGECLAAVERLARFGERFGLHDHADCAAGIQRLYDIAAEFG